MGRDGGFPLPNADVAKQSPEVYKAQCAIWYQTTILGRQKKDVAADLDQDGNADVRWLKTENEKGERLPSGQLSKFMNAGDPAQSDCNNANKVDSVNTKEKAAHINLTFQADHAQADGAGEGAGARRRRTRAKRRRRRRRRRRRPPPQSAPRRPPEPTSPQKRARHGPQSAPAMMQSAQRAPVSAPAVGRRKLLQAQAQPQAANAQVDAEAGPSPSIAVDARSASCSVVAPDSATAALRYRRH